MAKGDTFLFPTILTDTDSEALAKKVAAERIKREQPYAAAQYSAVFIARPVQNGSSNSGYTKYIAVIEFATEEK